MGACSSQKAVDIGKVCLGLLVSCHCKTSKGFTCNVCFHRRAAPHVQRILRCEYFCDLSLCVYMLWFSPGLHCVQLHNTAFTFCTYRAHCYTQITIAGEAKGRIVFELRGDVVPKTAENFRYVALSFTLPVVCVGRVSFSKHMRVRVVHFCVCSHVCVCVSAARYARAFVDSGTRALLSTASSQSLCAR